MHVYNYMSSFSKTCNIHSVNLLELSFMSKLAGLSPGNDDEVSTICFPHKLNIIVEGW